MSENQPKKSLGQHWLYDLEALEAMCDAALAGPGMTVLEIGPGLGTLTAKLVARRCTVIALEFDHELATSLIRNTSDRIKQSGETFTLDNVEVIEGDIRTFDFRMLPTDYSVCANIPYYLTSNLIRLLCDTENKPQRVALLMQKEVAQRIAAHDGKMSLLSCIAQFYYECRLAEEVPARLFTPPPKVDSQILVLARRQKPLYHIDSKRFFRLMRAGFSEKRKTLRNALSGGLSISKDDAVELLRRSAIDPMRRAETLNLAEWKQLYDNLDGLPE
jgi:16S rRNA (adenine1518-N6/adenine1519-N6)-dimethyltransferase